MTGETTALAIVGGFVLWVLYDLLAYAVAGNPATISRTALAVSNRARGFAVAVAFLFGVLFGHLFLPQHPDQDEKPKPEGDQQ